jgi:1-acyl-sn-glycerol-3-phosphate acyltransferase
MTRVLRGALALLVGAVIFSTASLLVFLISIATFGFARPLLAHAPMWVGKLFVVVVYRGILGMRIVVQSKMRNHHPHQTLVMANHPTMLLTMLFAAYAEPLAGVPVVFVGKRQHLNNPLVGWTLIASGLGILIDRSDRAGALETLGRLVAWVFARCCGLVIFPDQSRPTPEFLAAEQRKFVGVVPGLVEFRYTGVPRDGGVFACYDAMQSPRVVDITSECSVPTAYWRDIVGMVGRRTSSLLKMSRGLFHGILPSVVHGCRSAGASRTCASPICVGGSHDDPFRQRAGAGFSLFLEILAKKC